MNDTLEVGEVHPMAPYAYEYIKQNISMKDVESMASCAIEGNRLAEVCLGTYNRIENGEPVSDRYVLGLAWFVKQLRDNDYSFPVLDDGGFMTDKMREAFQTKYYELMKELGDSYDDDVIGSTLFIPEEKTYEFCERLYQSAYKEGRKDAFDQLELAAIKREEQDNG